MPSAQTILAVIDIPHLLVLNLPRADSLGALLDIERKNDCISSICDKLREFGSAGLVSVRRDREAGAGRIVRVWLFMRESTLRSDHADDRSARRDVRLRTYLGRCLGHEVEVVWSRTNLHLLFNDVAVGTEIRHIPERYLSEPLLQERRRQLHRRAKL